MKDKQTSAKSTTAKASKVFSDAERDAMKERAKSRRRPRAAGRARRRRTGESDVLAKIAAMPQSDRVMAERLHEIIKTSAPVLSPKTWYGMPA